MRVVFLEDVSGVAQGGDVKEVKNGFARNYLIPQKLAVAATHNALQRIEGLKKQAEQKRIKTIADMKALAQELNGLQVNIDMRSGANGRLYGSVTNAMIAEQLSELTDREIDRRIIEIDEPIRQLGNFEVSIRLHPEVAAAINVLVYPTGTDPNAVAEAEAAEEGEQTEGEESEAAVAEAEADTDDVPVAEAEPVEAVPASDEAESEDTDEEKEETQ